MRRSLAVSARVRGEDEVCKRLPQHSESKYIKSAARGEARAESFGWLVSWLVGWLVSWLGG